VVAGVPSPRPHRGPSSFSAIMGARCGRRCASRIGRSRCGLGFLPRPTVADRHRRMVRGTTPVPRPTPPRRAGLLLSIGSCRVHGVIATRRPSRCQRADSGSLQRPQERPGNRWSSPPRDTPGNPLGMGHGTAAGDGSIGRQKGGVSPSSVTIQIFL
jgi:hypothetical protein